jgi:drug/metabolite transporter (DMT)-like permease
MENNKRFTAPMGAGFVVLASLVYGSYGVWTKLMGDYFGIFTQAVFRAGIVVLFLMLLAIGRKQLSRLYWRRDALLIIFLLISDLLIPAPIYYAVNKVGVGLAMGIAYAGAVLGAFFFGWLLSRERYTQDKWLSTVFGIVGLWLVFSPNIQAFGLLAMVAALASGLGSGLNMVVNKKLRYSPVQTALLTWTTTVLANLPFIFILHEQIPTVNLTMHWLYLVLFSLASLTASWSLISGLKLIDAGTAGILGLLEIVFAIILGIVLFKEQLTFIVLSGMSCIIAAAAIPYITHYKNQMVSKK